MSCGCFQRHVSDANSAPVVILKLEKDGGVSHASYIPAEKTASFQSARFPQKNAEPEWQKGTCSSPRKGQSETHALKKPEDRMRVVSGKRQTAGCGGDRPICLCAAYDLPFCLSGV